MNHMTEFSTKSTAVENLQRYLRWLSLLESNIPPVAIDGIYGEETKDAVNAFQKAYGLEVTGIVDYATWTALFEAYLASLLEYQTPKGFSPFPRFPKGYAVGLGNRQFLVEVIQFMLNELSVEMDDIPRNAQSGLYDEDTETGVRAFQRAHLLMQTGKVDRATWDALVTTYQALQNEIG